MASRAPIVSTSSKGREPEKPVKQTETSARQNASADLEERIRVRAYEIYLERGQEGSSDLDDWLRAEREIIKP